MLAKKGKSEWNKTSTTAQLYKSSQEDFVNAKEKKTKENKNPHQTKATIRECSSLKIVYLYAHNKNTILRSIDPAGLYSSIYSSLLNYIPEICVPGLMVQEVWLYYWVSREIWILWCHLFFLLVLEESSLCWPLHFIYFCLFLVFFQILTIGLLDKTYLGHLYNVECMHIYKIWQNIFDSRVPGEWVATKSQFLKSEPIYVNFSNTNIKWFDELFNTTSLGGNKILI